MKKKASFALALAVALMLYAGAGLGEAAPLLYKVSDAQGNYIYLLGTIHVGNEEMYPLSEPIMDAYRDADALAVELDIVALARDMKQMLAYSAALMYGAGESAKDHLSPETYQMAMDHFGSSAMMKMMKPAVLLTLIQEEGYQRLGYSSSYGLDQKLIEMAYQDEKTVLPLETLEQQMHVLTGTPDALVDFQLQQVLSYPEASDASFKLLFTAWRQGNEEILRLLLSSESLSVPKELQAEYEAYAKALYADRDAAFTEKAIEYLEKGDKVLIAIGAAHIVSDGAIVDRLMDAGYTVEEIGR